MLLLSTKAKTSQPLSRGLMRPGPGDAVPAHSPAACIGRMHNEGLVSFWAWDIWTYPLLFTPSVLYLIYLSDHTSTVFLAVLMMSNCQPPPVVLVAQAERQYCLTTQNQHGTPNTNKNDNSTNYTYMLSVTLGGEGGGGSEAIRGRTSWRRCLSHQYILHTLYHPSIHAQHKANVPCTISHETEDLQMLSRCRQIDTSEHSRAAKKQSPGLSPRCTTTPSTSHFTYLLLHVRPPLALLFIRPAAMVADSEPALDLLCSKAITPMQIAGGLCMHLPAQHLTVLEINNTRSSWSSCCLVLKLFWPLALNIPRFVPTKKPPSPAHRTVYCLYQLLLLERQLEIVHEDSDRVGGYIDTCNSQVSLPYLFIMKFKGQTAWP